jgi:hypothetical protein
MYVLELCETAKQTNGHAARPKLLTSTPRTRKRVRQEDGSQDDTFLPKSGDSLPIVRCVTLFSAVLRPSFLLRLAPTRTTASGIVRGSARGQLDKFHTKRPTQDLLGFIKHGLKCAALRAHNFFRDLVAAEGHAPLFIKEREPNQIRRAFFQVLFKWSWINL